MSCYRKTPWPLDGKVQGAHGLKPLPAALYWKQWSWMKLSKRCPSKPRHHEYATYLP